VNAAGQVVAAFSHYSSTLRKHEVMARRYEPGVGWLEPGVVGAPVDTWSTGFFDVALDAQGNAIVLSWQYYTNSAKKLYGSRYRVGAGWAAAEELDSEIGWDTDSFNSRELGPRVVMNASGQALIVYWKGNSVYARWLK
jgi:hypothetical protein